MSDSTAKSINPFLAEWIAEQTELNTSKSRPIVTISPGPCGTPKHHVESDGRMTMGDTPMLANVGIYGGRGTTDETNKVCEIVKVVVDNANLESFGQSALSEAFEPLKNHEWFDFRVVDERGADKIARKYGVATGGRSVSTYDPTSAWARPWLDSLLRDGSTDVDEMPLPPYA